MQDVRQRVWSSASVFQLSRYIHIYVKGRRIEETALNNLICQWAGLHKNDSNEMKDSICH